MKFTVVKDSKSDFRAMSGYHFIGETEIDKTIYPDWSNNRWDREIDSFKDGWETVCTDENGDLYLVAFDWETHNPYIWQRIEADNE